MESKWWLEFDHADHSDSDDRSISFFIHVLCIGIHIKFTFLSLILLFSELQESSHAQFFWLVLLCHLTDEKGVFTIR